MISCVDLEIFKRGNEAERNVFVHELGCALNEIGFVAVKNHGLSDEQSAKLYASTKSFFSLSDKIKEKYEIEEIFGQRGYTGKLKESAKGRNVGDLKEFFHFGQENIPLELELSKHYPENVYVEELPDLMKFGNEVFEILQETGIYILRAVALYLDLDEFYFDEKVKAGNSILRAIHYFPIENETDLPLNAVRAAAHEDINLITLLMGASAEGLEILRKDGDWEAVTALPSQIVVNVGDMLSRLTNDKLSSTTHRVVNPNAEKLKEARYSIPFFMHPRADTDLTCLMNCISDSNPKRYEDVSAGDFLDERLREIGLKK